MGKKYGRTEVDLQKGQRKEEKGRGITIIKTSFAV